MSDKKKMQLGMNPSTASHRLVKDTLWRLITLAGFTACVKCGLEMTRDTFSIEHLEPWLDSEDPVGLYFDQQNIGFSHLKCNVDDARPKQRNFVCGTAWAYRGNGCRCEPCKEAYASERTSYSPDKRKERYKRLGT